MPAYVIKLIVGLFAAGVIYYATGTFVPEGFPRQVGYFVAGVVALVTLFSFLLTFLGSAGHIL